MQKLNTMSQISHLTPTHFPVNVLLVMKKSYFMTPPSILQANIHLQDYTLHDPGLTPNGREQCKALKAALNSHPIASRVGLIITSPLQRTMETLQLTLGVRPDSDAVDETSVPIYAHAEWQEITNNNIDIGQPCDDLKESEKWKRISFEPLESDPTWPKKEGLYAYSYEALTTRVERVTRWLRKREEKVVIVISHDGFLRLVSKRKYGHADFRVFKFIKGELVETEESETNGGGRGTCPKGRWGWLESDFKWMPNPPCKELIDAELEVTRRVENGLGLEDSQYYIIQVRVKLAKKPWLFHKFIEIVENYKSGKIGTLVAFDEIVVLFAKYPDLKTGFNALLPPGYSMDHPEESLKWAKVLGEY